MDRHTAPLLSGRRVIVGAPTQLPVDPQQQGGEAGPDCLADAQLLPSSLLRTSGSFLSLLTQLKRYAIHNLAAPACNHTLRTWMLSSRT